MLVATKPVKEVLISQAQTFLEAMRDEDFDRIWNYMVSFEAIELISATALLVSNIDEEHIDDYLTGPAFDGLSFAFQMDEVFSDDELGLRTSFFLGMREALESTGWYELFDEDTSYAFLGKDCAILIADTLITRRPLMLPFVENPPGNYSVDFEAVSAFSMQTSAQKLHRLATRALEIGEKRTALSLYRLAQKLGPVYGRLRELVWDHAVVGQIVTDERRSELQAEFAYTLLAQEMYLELRTDPQLTAGSIDMSDFLRAIFAGYDRILDCELETHDFELLNQMNDSALRSAIAQILNGVDPVEAQREARKPHTVAEIADMEVLVRHGNELYHLLMPVKSGQEIRGSSVPVEVFYQILRPHLFFQKGVVVFITAKPCSQPLLNYIKQARDRLGWPIAAIEERELARLLKVNNLLPRSTS